MLKISNLLKYNGLILFYLLMFGGLVFGVYETSGTKYLNFLLTYIVALLAVYFLLKFINKKKQVLNTNFSFSNKLISNLNLNLVSSVLIILSFLIIIIHYIDIGFVPLLKAYFSTDYYEIVNIRKQASLLTESLNRYLSFFLIKAIIPFLLLYLLHKKKYILYFTMLIIGSFYAMSLMQKSFVLTLLFPSIFYSFINKKFIVLGFNFIVVFIYIYGLLWVTNPSLRNIEIPDEIKNQPQIVDDFLEENKELAQKRNKIFGYAIYKRVFLVPGKMVAKWFEHVPKSEPFLYGCGYRVLAPVLGCEYKNYGQELYDDIFPKYAARGIQGNANATNFMYDYANFGVWGLILAGLVMGFVLFFFDTLFSFSLVYKLAINSFYIFMLSSSALTTLLYSGGWGLIILLFFIFKKDFVNE